jgi:hypothetical protein
MNFIGRSGSLLVVALYEAHLSRHTNTVTSAILAVSAASQRAGAHTSTVNSDNQTHAEDPPLPKRFYRTANVQASEKVFPVRIYIGVQSAISLSRFDAASANEDPGACAGF